MADFRAAGDSITRFRRKNKFTGILFLIALVLIVLNRNAIVEKVTTTRENVSNFVSETKDKVVRKLKGVVEIELVEDDLSDLSMKTIIGIYTTSQLESEEWGVYEASRMIDGDFTTAWQEGVDGYGQGESIKLRFSGKRKIQYLVIYNGSQSSEGSFTDNNRVKTMEVKIGRKVVNVELEDVMGPQVFKVTGARKTKRITLNIQSVYEGTVYNDTAITEIQCY